MLIYRVIKKVLKKLLLVISITQFINLLSYGQVYELRGKVTDISSREPLAFVNIQLTGTGFGTSTDIDGEFLIKSNLPIITLTLSYVGFKTTVYEVKGAQGKVIIPMEREVYKLKEVEIKAGENPAINIIKQASKNRSINNIENYRSYSELYFSDYIFDNEATSSYDKDSISEFDNFLKSVEVFLLQNVSEKDIFYSRDTMVRASTLRFVGYQNPDFNQMGTSMTNINLYEEKITIGSVSYISPISRRGLNRFYYILGDTLCQKKDTIFVILFRQYVLSRHEKEGLSGLLYISKKKYNLKNVVLNHIEEASNMRIKIHQKYEIYKRGEGITKRVHCKSATNIMMWYQ